MACCVKVLTSKGERYIGKSMQLTNASHAGKWTEKKAKNVAKARLKSSDIFECHIVNEGVVVSSMYKDGDCAENKQGGGKTSRKKQIHPEPEEPEDFRLDLDKFGPAAPSKELEPEGSRLDFDKFAPAALSKRRICSFCQSGSGTAEADDDNNFPDFLSLCDKAQNLLSTYSQKQAQEEALQEDLLHIIELTANVDAARGYQLYKDLRDCRKRRRVAKDMANLLGGVLRLGNEDSAQNMRRLVQSMSGREYHSRVDNRVIFF